MKHKFGSMGRVAIALVLALSLSLVMATPAYADHALTPGGSVDIDADTNGGDYTTLDDIVFTDPGPDLAATNTFYLTAPDGFEFNPTPGTATGSGYGTTDINLGPGAGAAASPDYSESDTIATWTVTTAGDGVGGSITISGMELRPTTAKTEVVDDGTAMILIAGDTIFDSNDAHPIRHVPGALDKFEVVPVPDDPVVGETSTVTITAQDQFDNTVTTTTENLLLSQTGAIEPALLSWGGADVIDYGDGTGRFIGSWTNGVATVDVSYTRADEAVTLAVTGVSSGEFGQSALVTWGTGFAEILTIKGTTYQNGNDTIVIGFNTEVQPASEGPWSATVFALVKCGDVNLSLVGATFTPSGLTDTLTITLNEDVAYLVNTKTVFVTPALEAIKDAAGNFVPNTQVVSEFTVSGDSVDPTVALTYDPNRDVKDADTLVITATFSEAMADTPKIAIATQGGSGDLIPTKMSMGADRTEWSYNWDVASTAAVNGEATVTITGDDLAGKANELATNNKFTIDNTLPTITSIVGSTFGVDNILITFSEDVAATDGDFTGNEVAGITLKKTGETDVTVDLTGATFEKTDPELDFTTTLTITLAETGNVQDYLINDYTVTFDPSDTNTIEDGAGNLLDTAAIDGTTTVSGDGEALTMVKVVGMIKTGDDTVTITFAEKVRPADGIWSANEFSIESPVGAPLNIDHANFTLDATNTILTITLNQATDGAFLVMGYDVKVALDAGDVLDLAGNPLAAASVTSVVEIADPAFPYITSIVGTTILGAGDTIVITFSKAVEPADDEVTPGWSKDEFILIKCGATTLPLTNATFDATDTVLTITLDEATDGEYLVNGDKVFVTPVTSAIEDAVGNPVPNTEVESAVVGGDTDAPTIVSIAGTIVPEDTDPEDADIIRIDFSEAVVPLGGSWTVDGQFIVTGAAVNLTNAAFAPASGITTTLTITLEVGVGKDLTAGTLMVAPKEDQILDLAGNAMTTDPVDSAAPVQAPLAAFVIDLEADWNLISLPLVPTEPDIEAVLAGLVNANTVIQVRAYNTSDNSWSIWASTGPYALKPTLTEMKDGLGFWIKMNTGDKLVASGSVLPAPPLSPPSYPVYEGWNLIGFKSLDLTTGPKEYLGTLVDDTREAIYGYDAGTGYFIPGVPDGHLLEPGYGYWLAVNTDGTIYP